MEKIGKKDCFLSHVDKNRDTYVDAMSWALDKVESMIPDFSDGYPPPSSINNVYPSILNIEWTSGFYSGLLWLSYLNSKKEVFKKAAMDKLDDYEERLEKRIETATHDLGFLYILSSKAEYLITGNTRAKEITLKAARLLMERYWEKAGIIQAWGDMNNKEECGRIIIDCLMNIPLLFWAHEVTGEVDFKTAAVNHLDNSIRYLIRSDDTSFHTYFFDVETGVPLYGKTAQGYSDSSCWARGQAWGIYGLSLCYRYTKDSRLLDKAKALANHFLNSLPDDNVCYWDLIFTSGTEERDSSAAAIAASALLELASSLSVLDEERSVYEAAALVVLKSLSVSYTTKGLKSNGLLKHAVYGKPFDKGVDECNIYGDYFYMEALDRILNGNRIFW